MKKHIYVMVLSSMIAYASPVFSGACLDNGGSLTSDQTTQTMNIINNLIHPDDQNTINYVKECFTYPLTGCQMAVDLTFHVSASDAKPHLIWRIGKSQEGIYTSKVRTMHIYKADDKYTFQAFDTGRENKDEPCN